MITRLHPARTLLCVLVFTFIVYPAYSQQIDADGASTESELLFADDGAADAAEAEGVSEIGTFGVGDLIRMVIVLALVAGAVYGVIALLRRKMPGNEEDTDSPIRVLASRRLGTTGEVFAVMVGKSVFVLGGSESGVQRIATIEDQETIDELVLAHSRTVPARKTFAGSLGEWLSNFAVPGSQRGESKGAETITNDGGFQQRLQRLRKL